MDDRDVLNEIGTLVEEEHGLRERGEGLDPDELHRLRELEVRLDQYWDLLRQRRAKRDAGEDPDAVAPRPPEVVETYEQ